MKRLVRLLADILVALSGIGVFVGLYRFGVMALIEDLTRLSDVQLTFIRRVGVVGALFIAYVLVARFYERREIAELQVRPLETSVSAFFGAGLIGLTILLLNATGNYQMISIRGVPAALGIVGAILAAALLEEAIFRGILFRLIEEHAGTLEALVVQALIFGSLHFFNEGTSLMTIVSVTLIGAFWTLIFVHTRNLWVVAANHFAWNVTIFLSGLPLSGQEAWRSAAPLETIQQGPLWLTGGAFGPEDSIVTIAVVAAALARLGYLAWRAGQFREGSWAAARRDHVCG